MRDPALRQDPAQRLLTLLLLLTLAVVALARYRQSQLPPPSALLPALYQSPIQTPVIRAPFPIDYRGARYHIVPRANYELWGLVVSHNDIHGWSDIYHDDNSFDTRDVCVIWGANLSDADYRHVSYSSGAWTCFVRWQGNPRFHPEALSNNHLITGRQDLRERIDEVRVGDQIHLRGLLVDYAREPSADYRRTSLVRTDEGNGACEVLYVEALDILQPGAPLWHILYRAGWVSAIGIMLLKIRSSMRFQRHPGLHPGA